MKKLGTNPTPPPDPKPFQPNSQTAGDEHNRLVIDNASFFEKLDSRRTPIRVKMEHGTRTTNLYRGNIKKVIF